MFGKWLHKSTVEKSILPVFYPALLLVFLLLFPVAAFSETVTLPITIDFPMLRSLVVQEAFTGPDQSQVLLSEGKGCRKIVISEPVFSQSDSMVQFETKIQIQIGAVVFGKCRMPLKWDGFLHLIQRPAIDDSWVLSFDTVDSRIYNRNHEPAKIASLVWDYLKTYVFDYLNSITINLAPPVSELKAFIHPIFPTDLQKSAERMVSSMRPGVVTTVSDAVRVEILAEVDQTFKDDDGLESERITEQELKEFTERWEIWDAFLIHTVASLVNGPLTIDDRQVILDTILDTRYEFLEAIWEDRNTDFVRRQFISAWKQLSPVMRSHLSREPSRSILSYLAFFTASDALIALDKIGPSLGIDISREGFFRLARMISDDRFARLEYRPGIDTRLRKILGLDKSLETKPPLQSPNGDKQEGVKSRSIGDRAHRLAEKVSRFLFRPAHASLVLADNSHADKADWIVRQSNLTQYLNRVKALLMESAEQAATKAKLSEEHLDLYRRIVLSTAWQESCFRQFKEKNENIVYLRSYDGSSVGMMQINERVWRGLYNEKILRWDIQYNAAAGCEIAGIYFNRYTLRKIREMGLDMDAETMARVTYAMYNGGPRQFHKFIERHRKDDFYLSDELFFEKYSWIETGEWNMISKCLFGG